jgi:hypothetical protein
MHDRMAERPNERRDPVRSAARIVLRDLVGKLGDVERLLDATDPLPPCALATTFLDLGKMAGKVEKHLRRLTP